MIKPLMTKLKILSKNISIYENILNDLITINNKL